tara:strand:+ start:2650 stop:5235 length:2586 start_codon:yes stop_codon:yes gene_type:complete
MAVNSQNISALVPGKGKARAQPTREVVDERVLRLLGIEAFEVEMDYDTYKDALRRVMIESRMGGSKLPSEEAEAVTNEWRRVKGRKGRFIAKKKVIKAKDIQKAGATSGLSRKAISGAAVGVPAGLLAAAATAPPAEGRSGVLQAIQDSLDNIVKVLKEQNKLDRKAIEKDRKQKLRTRRDRLKDSLKGGAKAVATTAKKVIKPVQNILGDIMGVLLKLLFGKALLKLLKWFSDPANDEKKAALFKFFKDFWPMMTSAVVAFGTAVGPMIAGLVKTIGGFVVTLVTKIIPGLVSASVGLAKHLGWKGLAIGGVAGAGWLGNKLLNPDEVANKASSDPDPDSDSVSPTQGGTSVTPTPSAPDSASTTSSSTSNKIDPVDVLNKNRHLLPNIPFMDPYQIVLDKINEDPSAYDTKAKIEAALNEAGIDTSKVRYATGGFVSGPGGVDRVSAKLTAGEFVMSKGAVDKWGTDTLAAMNAAGGGTNNPSFGRYNTGGKVEKPKSTQEEQREKDNKGGGLWGWARGLMGFGTDDKPVTGDLGEGTDFAKRSGTEKGGISRNAKALLNTIRWAEGTLKPGGYNTWFGGRTDMDLTRMSIDEVVAEQKRRLSAGEATYGRYTSAAVGAYQMMLPDEFASRAGLNGSSLFTPENQDKMAIAAYMKGKLTNKEIDSPITRETIAKIAGVWASLPTMSGASAHGQPVKKYSDLEKVYNKNLKSLDPNSYSTSTTSIALGKGSTSVPGQQPGQQPGKTGDSATGSEYARAISDAEIDALIASEFGGAQQRGFNRPPQTKFSPVAKATPPSPPSHSLQSIGDAIKRGDTKGGDSTVMTIPESSANAGTQLPQFDVSSHALQIERSSTVLGINA